MITFDKLVDDVYADHLATGNTEVDIADVDNILRLAVKRLGLCVHANTGEVYNPAPAPVINYPNQNGARQPRMRRRR